MESPKKVELTPEEQSLRQLLLGVVRFIEDSPDPGLFASQVHLPDHLAEAPLVLRFTGGWVRDKCLGVKSHDIDVAINKMTGYEFALYLKKYIAQPHIHEQFKLPVKEIGLYKIEANPEKSKHLETTTLKLLGMDIDLVNLRKEAYSSESRNPQIEFGSPQEDAYRRDATINALFYNLNSQIVEDFTERGLDDLEHHIIRTPLDPFQTFIDDPLRVLRLIRFSSRLDYQIDDHSLKTMSHPTIRQALHQKISRERVGMELEKMLKGPNPRKALDLILNLGLYDSVFSFPTLDNTWTPTPIRMEPALRVVEFLVHNSCFASARTASPEEVSSGRSFPVDLGEAFPVWMLAAFVPWADAPEPESPKPGKTPLPLAAQVARDSIKAPNKLRDLIAVSVRHRNEILECQDKLDAGPLSREFLGMKIRRWGPTWVHQILFASMVEAAHTSKSIEGCVEKANKLIAAVRDFGVAEAYNLRPILTGEALANAMGLKPGPWVRETLEQVVIPWQLCHPDDLNVERAIEAVRQRTKGELTQHLVDHFLKLTIRPAFAKTQIHGETLKSMDRINTSGRAITNRNSVVTPSNTFVDETDSKPWKNRDACILDQLQWTVEALQSEDVESRWPLLVPPLMILMDDPAPLVKTRGAELIARLLRKTSPTLFTASGLSEVFEDALFPCLQYLPGLTDEIVSARLLNAAYVALEALADIRFAHGLGSSRMHPKSMRGTYVSTDVAFIAFWDKVMRQGVLYGLKHAIHSMRVVRVLLDHIPPLLFALGIESVKHLNSLLHNLSVLITDPFPLAHSPIIAVALQALQATILSCWPRIAPHRNAILQSICVCWVNCMEEDSTTPSILGVQDHLRCSLRLLELATTDELRTWHDLTSVTEANPLLHGLLLQPD